MCIINVFLLNLRQSIVVTNLLKLLLSGKAQAIHGVGAAVSPLAKLLGGFGEGHVGGDGAVDDCLGKEEEFYESQKQC